MVRPKILGALLHEAGAVSAEQLERALEDQHGTGLRLGQLLVSKGVASEVDVGVSLSRQVGLPWVAPPLRPTQAAVELIPGEVARSRGVAPLDVEGRAIRVAVSDPLDLSTADDLRFLTGRRVDLVVSTRTGIEDAIERAYGGDLERLVDALPTELKAGAASSDELERATRSAPVVRLVDRVLREAADSGASDIHVEETGEDVRVRFRIDGVLRPAVDIPAAARRAVLSRIKVMAGMDISVRRRAQDGRLTFAHRDRSLMLRVSTLPVNGGEKAVVRILDPDASPGGMDTLGLSDTDTQRMRTLLRAREGVVLATGPTGSGKSTTLFAALTELDRDRLNVVTLEDPVEYRLAGANQVQVDRRAGLSFADALRAVLRQDPDVVMVGEIRDRETAEIAMAAAVTGHLVLSTLHTTDAPGAISRLVDMGVPPFLVAGGVTGVIAQRLVRKICGVCGGRGCDQCHEGYRGRTGIFQLLALSDQVRDEITRGAGTSRIRSLSLEAGMTTLTDDARRAVAEGLTTPHEIARVLHTDPGATVACAGCGGGVPAGAAGCPHCGRRRARSCACGERLQRGWRFCPACIRKTG